MISKQVSSLSRRVYSTVTVNLGSEFQNAKPFSDIPTISTWKAIKESLPGGRYYNKTVRETALLMHDDYGDIMRIPAMLGKPEMIMTFDAENFEKVFRVEGIWPVRLGLDSLEYYRKTKRPDIYGDLGSLIVSQGEKWSQMRTVANPILMQPKTIKKYTTQIDDIAKEFIELMKQIRNERSEMPGDFSNYVNTWSLESVIAVGLERRLNLFNENTNDKHARLLIKSIREFFEKTAEYDGKVSIWKYYQTKGFKELIKTYDNMTDVMMHYMDEAIEKIKKEKSSDDKEDSVLRKLLEADKRIAMVVTSDLMLAGVDTTASSVLNIMYLLAKNPEKQETLRKEVMQILPEKNSKLTPEKTKNMPYLRAVIKEAFRVLPVVSGTARQTTKDIVISNYHIPPQTTVIMQTLLALVDERYYPEPDKFIPERWLRGEPEGCPRSNSANPFAFLPFGFGSRSCLGKRIAELEMETLICNIIRNFKIEWHYPDMKIKSTFVNIPDSEMRYKIIDV